MKEQAREDRGAAGRAGEGPCGLVIKPLRPDVHLNQKLFPVVVVFFNIFYFIFCLPEASLREGKGFSEKKKKKSGMTNKSEPFAERLNSETLSSLQHNPKSTAADISQQFAAHCESFSRLSHTCLIWN